MMIATLIGQRGTCTRAHVGAVIVKDRRIISTGYVGSPPGQSHCLDVGCLIDEATQTCTRTIHAEANAIAYAARSGLSVEDAVLYSTHAPCRACSHLAASAGIRQVFYLNDYHDTVFTPGVNWVHFQPNVHSHPYMAFKSEQACELCGKSELAHT